MSRYLTPARSRNRLGLALLTLLCFPSAASAQQELRPYRQVAYESGRGTWTIKRAPGNGYYALNRADRCVWMFSPSGNSTGHISSIGMGPSDLLSPHDLAVDSTGNAIVADAAGAIKILSPSGQLLSSVPFPRPHHVGVLSDGRILASGLPKDSLISIFDRQGSPLGNIGTPAIVDDNPFFNSILNVGTIVVDARDNIYYAFTYMLTPTIRRYKADGTLVSEWHITEGDKLNQTLTRARQTYLENKKAGRHGGLEVLTAAAFDEDSQTLWVAAADQLNQLDLNGRVIRILKLVRADGTPLTAKGLLVEKDTIRASTYTAGTFEFPKPH